MASLLSTRVALRVEEALVRVRDAGRAVEIAQEEVTLRKRHLHFSYPTDDQSSPWVEVSVDGVTAANLLDTLDYPFDAFDLSVEADRLRIAWGNRTPTFRLVTLLPDLISTLTAANLLSDREGARVLRLR
ncbi:hypothetical protein [Microbacterium lacticum]|uniref:Uncharacterized protein n=1 Tax=Microbacterium lacticum TaxID=33885 RepID=A0A4Y3UPJ5_9MICO|nr:hypothetical protein [Microbacterium lacticum]TQM90966.1 hypothetical protein FHX68_2820 [Microbacterium lacticum]GEB96072.1 hypothetical protein MLA01_22910 [Microbacterium lacticum]GGI71646.1 hypothetical protein GCM10009724_23180 [Microbacterium lacticum]